MSVDLKRFLAFAFASADLLIEVDLALDITFVFGATSGMAESSDTDLLGRSFLTLLAESDRQYAATLLQDLKPAARCGPVMVRLAIDRDDGASREALLHACRLPTSPRNINLTLAQPSMSGASSLSVRRPKSGEHLLDENAFKEAARQLAEKAHGLRRSLELTFFDLPSLADSGEAGSDVLTSELVQGIGALLRSVSADGATAGRLGQSRFGIVHDSARSAEEIRSRLAEVTVRPDRMPPEIKSATVEIARDGLPPGMAAHAVEFVVERVARQGIDADQRADLRDVFGGMVEATLQRVKAFSDTVSAEDFKLVYQPVASLETGRFHHFEALTRFKFDESPLAVIQFAEEVGVIEQMDLAVVARMVHHMRQPGFDRRTSFAVNVSSQSFGNMVFVNCLLQLLSSHQALAGRLAIEVTESARIRDPKETNHVLQEIRRAGFAVTLDDVGAGAENLRSLRGMSVDFVKIDVANARRAGGAQRYDADVVGLVRLCGDLGIGTIAERVETRDQARILRDIGVQYGQGYQFGRPTQRPDLPWDFGNVPMRFATAR